MLTFIQAAIQILSEAEEPLSSDEITRQALALGLLQTTGKTPIRSMNARLHYEIKSRGEASRVTQIGPNQFAYNRNPGLEAKSIVKPHGQVRQETKIERPRKTSSVHEMLDHELYTIRTYLNGTSDQPPTSEKICDWVTLCYSLGFYSEGAELFNCVDASEVNQWYYERTKKMAWLCILHQSDK